MQTTISITATPADAQAVRLMLDHMSFWLADPGILAEEHPLSYTIGFDIADDDPVHTTLGKAIAWISGDGLTEYMYHDDHAEGILISSEGCTTEELIYP